MSGGKPVSGGVSFSGDSVILCARPYADGGNACRSSGECDGRCVIGEWKDRPIFHFDPNYYPKNAVGHCDYYDQQPNCLYNVELLGDDRVLQVGWCIVS